MPLTLRTASADETFALGQKLGPLLQAGDVLLLDGELGSGKTRFTQGIALGLGITDPVKSSSFILLAEYQGRLRLYHADLYRLESPQEVADLSLPEVAAEGVLVVEWADRARQEMPAEHLDLRFTYLGETERGLELTPHGRRAEVLFDEFKEMAQSS